MKGLSFVAGFLGGMFAVGLLAGCSLVASPRRRVTPNTPH